jgi:hypothetical protein
MINITPPTKVCIKCTLPKNTSEFSKDKSTGDGLQQQCKSCKSEHFKQWKLNNPKYHKLYNKQHYIDTKEEYQKRSKKYNTNNKERVSEYMMERYHTDLLYRLKSILRCGTRRYIQGKKSHKTEQILGCTFEELKQHIESQWVDGMSWGNWTQDGWHIDHIIPLASAKTETEIYKLNHYTNLQPLWALDNQSKGAKYFKS